MKEVTRILFAIEEGEPQAAEQLLPLVYDELRRLAAEKIARERPGYTLEATALVHEAFVRLVEVDKVQQWQSRGHFFRAAAEAMRHILVDRARRKRSHKRGGGRARVKLDEPTLAAAEDADEILAVDEALAGLAAADPMPRAGQAPLLCPAVHSGGRPGPEHRRPQRRPAVGVRACLAAPGHRRAVNVTVSPACLV